MTYRLGALVGVLVLHDRYKQGKDILLACYGGEYTPVRPTLTILGINHNWIAIKT